MLSLLENMKLESGIKKGHIFKKLRLMHKAFKLLKLSKREIGNYLLYINPNTLSYIELKEYINDVFNKSINRKDYVYNVKIEVFLNFVKFSDFFLTTTNSFTKILDTYYEFLDDSSLVILTITHYKFKKTLIIIHG